MNGVAVDSDRLIDQVLPAWDFREVHDRTIEASAEDVMAALRAVTPAELPFSGLMLAARLAPAALAARRWPIVWSRSWLNLLIDFGFTELGNSDDEVVVGAVGQFWRVRETTVPLAGRDAFIAFDEPRYAKGVMNFRVVKDGGGSVRLSTETRVLATDEQARRAFRPYWIPVRAVGGLMRREMLGAVARSATRSVARSI
jgi:hypothetical protein